MSKVKAKFILDAITGNYAAAWGARLSRVKMVAAYPITPQTTIVELLAEWIDRGELNAKMIRVESEHSAMAATLGAAAVGVRAFTATSSQGFLYMYEMVHWTARARAPAVMAVVNRFIAPPWNIWSDWTDALTIRDGGWIMIWPTEHQEILDSIIQAFKIAEDKRVLLPALVTLGGMTMSHTAAPVKIWTQELVDEYLPPEPPSPLYVLDPDESEPITFGNIVLPEDTPQHVWAIEKAMRNARDVIEAVVKEFNELFGTDYAPFISTYKTDDADYVIVSMGDAYTTCEVAVDMLREKGIKIGAIKVRTYRPFPKEEIAKAIDGVSKVFIVDRDIAFGMGGILATDIKATLFDFKIDTDVHEVILGLGGAEISPERVISRIEKILKK